MELELNNNNKKNKPIIKVFLLVTDEEGSDTDTFVCSYT